MARTNDIGQYVNELTGGVDNLKLMKLCYFAQGWHLAWSGRPLFTDELQAWKHGPVSRALWDKLVAIKSLHGSTLAQPLGNSSNLSDYEREVVAAVVEFYAGQNSWTLRNWSHDAAWLAARGDLPEDASCSNAMSVTDIRNVFSDKARTDSAVPSAPLRPDSLDALSWGLDPEAEAELEADWAETFLRLADR